MPPEQGAPLEAGARDVTPVPGPGGAQWVGTLPAGASSAVAPAESSPEPIPTEASPAAAPVEASPAAVPGEAADTGRSDPVAWLIALAAFAAYTTISVFRYLRLDPGSWD